MRQSIIWCFSWSTLTISSCVSLTVCERGLVFREASELFSIVLVEVSFGGNVTIHNKSQRDEGSDTEENMRENIKWDSVRGRVCEIERTTKHTENSRNQSNTKRNWNLLTNSILDKHLNPLHSIHNWNVSNSQFIQQQFPQLSDIWLRRRQMIPIRFECVELNDVWEKNEGIFAYIQWSGLIQHQFPQNIQIL
jgi:hypothetical protein